jgi:hypothetical protein
MEQVIAISPTFAPVPNFITVLPLKRKLSRRTKTLAQTCGNLSKL